MIIQHAIVEDAEQILNLQKKAFQSVAEIYGPDIKPMLQTLEEMRTDIENHIVLKAVLDGQIVGSIRAYMKNETCHIGRLFVDPALQKRGIGKSLMYAIEKEFNQATRFELFTGFKSTKAINLYELIGYKEYDKVWVNEKLTRIYMEKSN